jgi:hypothetical protein
MTTPETAASRWIFSKIASVMQPAVTHQVQELERRFSRSWPWCAALAGFMERNCGNSWCQPRFAAD